VFGFDKAMGGVEKFVHAENEFKLISCKSWVGWLRRFRHGSAVDPGTESFRQAGAQVVFREDIQRVGASGGIGKRGTGGESRFPANGNVADGQSEYGGGIRRLREASALYRRDVFANRIDFMNGRAASDQRAIQLLNLR